MTHHLHIPIACAWEALARKVGNVHPGASFAGTSLNDFILSALAIRDPLATAAKQGVGPAILDAVQATREVVGQNTNLGMILLLAPLAAVPHGVPMRRGVGEILSRLAVVDADAAFRAIRLAQPGGLGDAPDQDVNAAPTVTLLEAMTLAADRDSIARQYSSGFSDVFELGVPALVEGFGRFGSVEAAIVHAQFCWLAAIPDSLIARKRGPAAAEDVRQRAVQMQSRGGIATEAGRRAGVELDGYLRSDGNRLNPGTTADLIAATLYIALRDGLLRPADPFPWTATDWLST
jgi:triphosphoribosyl-dephospho-CoA synthase